MEPQIAQAAVVLAAGAGSRLRPRSGATPKPLMPLGGLTLLERNLELLAAFGITDVAITLHHGGDQIRRVVGDAARFGLRVRYSEEPVLLGTATGAAQAAALLPRTRRLLIVYGDNLIAFDLGRLYLTHTLTGADLTLAVQQVADVRDKGVVEMDERDRVVGFSEKPSLEGAAAGWINAGVYLTETRQLEQVPRLPGVDFARDVFPAMLADGAHIVAHRLKPDETVVAIDTPRLYDEAFRRFDLRHGTGR